jgi:hypothetical protein
MCKEHRQNQPGRKFQAGGGEVVIRPATALNGTEHEPCALSNEG